MQVLKQDAQRTGHHSHIIDDVHSDECEELSNVPPHRKRAAMRLCRFQAGRTLHLYLETDSNILVYSFISNLHDLDTFIKFKYILTLFIATSLKRSCC